MSHNFTLKDITFMQKALQLAKRGMGWTNPNPMVGALIVKNRKIIGSGYHRKLGLFHAEVEALNSAKRNVKGATFYVNLEPCIHFGRTPPCVNQIIKLGIKKVVCSTLDPNPRVKGRGIKILKDKGVEVEVGLLEKEAKKLNEAFFTYHQKNRPFIALKFASSLDGKIATKNYDSKWITDELARNYARSLRSQYQAVLVGIQTVIKDNPHLGVRIKARKDPLRIILDSDLKIPLNSLALRDQNVLMITTSKANTQKRKKLKENGISIIDFNSREISLIELMRRLYERQIISLLVEGGGQTLGSFVDERLVDKVYAFYSPTLIGGEQAISAVRGNGVEKINEAIRLKNLSYKKLGNDFLISGYAQ